MSVEGNVSDSPENHIPHILIVDDQQANRFILGRILNDYQIMEAEDGIEALELINQYEFDLILLDIMMPQMNGLEVLEIIRSTASSSELPVIIVSALAEKQNMVQGLQMGANDYMPKPIDATMVQARVNAQLQMKRAYDMQQQANLELKRADMLKNKLLSIASHDLKAPLSSIYMAESLMRQMTDQSDPTMAAVLDTMKMTLDHMNQIIVEFLDMASLQNGAITVDIQPVDLQPIVVDVINHYRMQSREKGSVIIPPDGNASAQADPARLRQILSNLVSNALKYSPPNSQINIDIIHEDESCVIEVHDQGAGIPEAERELLFTEFGKLSTRPTGEEGSTGLGLWIVKQMTEMMNGRVGVYCPDTGGSVFWIELPTSSSMIESTS